MTRLVEDLLDVTRVSRGEVSLRREVPSSILSPRVSTRGAVPLQLVVKLAGVSVRQRYTSCNPVPAAPIYLSLDRNKSAAGDVDGSWAFAESAKKIDASRLGGVTARGRLFVDAVDRHVRRARALWGPG